MEDKIWETFLEYAEEYNIMPRHIAEFIAVMPIVKDCVEGYSNSSIARRTKFDLDYIKETLETIFGFSGWGETLNFSPIAVYNTNKGDVKDFTNAIVSISNVPKAIIAVSYNICKAYNIMKKEVEEYYKDQ